MNFQQFQIKWKIVKHFARPKQWATFRKLYSLPPFHPPPDKTLLHLWNKSFLKEIFRNIQTFAFKVLQECNSWTSRNGAVQYFFWHQTKTWLLENLWSQKYFWLCWGSNVKWVEVRKMSDAFWAKLYCKMCDLFC